MSFPSHPATSDLTRTSALPTASAPSLGTNRPLLPPGVPPWGHAAGSPSCANPKSHSLASCSSAPHYTCEHAHQQQPGSQSLPHQDPRGAPPGAPKGAVSHALCEPLMASQQHLKQFAAQTRAPSPAASMLIPRDSRDSHKTSAHTIQVTCNTVFTKSQALVTPLAATATQSTAEHQERLAMAGNQHNPSPAEDQQNLAMQEVSLIIQQLPEKLSPAGHHGRLAMQQVPSMTQQQPEQLTTAEPCAKAAVQEAPLNVQQLHEKLLQTQHHEKLAVQEASLVSPQMLETLLLPFDQNASQTWLLLQPLTSMTQQIHKQLVKLVSSVLAAVWLTHKSVCRGS